MKLTYQLPQGWVRLKAGTPLKRGDRHPNSLIGKWETEDHYVAPSGVPPSGSEVVQKDETVIRKAAGLNTKRLRRGDVVEIPGKNHIKGVVLKVIGEVVMFVPWNSGHEDIMLAKDLKFIKSGAMSVKEPPRGY